MVIMLSSKDSIGYEVTSKLNPTGVVDCTPLEEVVVTRGGEKGIFMKGALLCEVR